MNLMTYNSDIDTIGHTTISSLFDSRLDAERAVERLREDRKSVV